MLAVKNIYLLNVTLKEAQMVICACAHMLKVGWGSVVAPPLLLSPEGCTFDHRSQPVKHTERLREPTSEWENTVRDILPRPGGGNGAWRERWREKDRERDRDTETGFDRQTEEIWSAEQVLNKGIWNMTGGHGCVQVRKQMKTKQWAQKTSVTRRRRGRRGEGGRGLRTAPAGRWRGPPKTASASRALLCTDTTHRCVTNGLAKRTRCALKAAVRKILEGYKERGSTIWKVIHY